MNTKKSISIIGSTGSIGRQSLKVAKTLGITVYGLSAFGNNLNLLEQQAREFNPLLVSVTDEKFAKDLKLRLNDTNIEVDTGIEGMCRVAGETPADMTITSVVGIAGLLPTLSAIRNKKIIGLANKETLVCAGDIIMREAQANNVQILPVDSEHCAVFQALHGENKRDIKRIILTASGGPFFGFTLQELETVTKEKALKHPNWSMGAKISIDSATLVNKGLEVIEAVHLFGVPVEKVEVVVHRESIIHSMVEFCDNSIIAQLSNPDMCLPIQYAITYPERVESATQPIDWAKLSSLTFHKPDIETFRALPLAVNAIKTGGNMPCAYNGSNERAVELFLQRKIKFTQITDAIEYVVSKMHTINKPTMDDILQTDLWARETVNNYINMGGKK